MVDGLRWLTVIVRKQVEMGWREKRAQGNRLDAEYKSQSGGSRKRTLDVVLKQYANTVAMNEEKV